MTTSKTRSSKTTLRDLVDAVDPQRKDPPIVYRFSSRKTFRDRRNPYQNF